MKSRKYHVIVVNDKTGYKDYMTATPVTHKEGCIIMTKMVPYKNVRYLLEEVVSVKKSKKGRY